MGNERIYEQFQVKLDSCEREKEGQFKVRTQADAL